MAGLEDRAPEPGLSAEEMAANEQKVKLFMFLLESNRKERRAAGFKGPLPHSVRMAKMEELHAPRYNHPRVKDKYGNLIPDEEFYEGSRKYSHSEVG